MTDNRFPPSQIASIVKQLDDGADVDAICRKYNIHLNTLYGWKARYGGTECLLRRLDELETENYQLKGRLSDIQIQRNAGGSGDTDRIYRILAANIPGTAITILDREERYLLAEGDFLVTMGYVKETMPGKKISEVISPENYEDFYKDVIKRAFDGESLLVERQTLSKYYTLMRVVPLRNGEGDIFAVMFVLIDVTQMKHAQTELSKMNEALELKVADRTAQLEELNRQLEAFSYSVSHDLRAPLRSILGFAKILKEDFSARINDEEFDNLATRVLANASRMENLISDLLTFSRLERKEIMKTTVDMDVLVREVLSELIPEPMSPKIQVTNGKLQPATADHALIRQVWTNLISNAIKYSSKKSDPRIEITCHSENGFTQYTVSDNGAGFSMKYTQKLFGVFQRLHTTSEFEGTGVGLALVKSIVQRHGGKVWAESEVGKGATFHFTLPSPPENQLRHNLSP